MNNPHPKFCGKAQLMTTEAGAAKGLKQMLEECSFNVEGMHAKCNPIFPLENTGCCMARLLSKQDDFWLQESLLEQKMKVRGHICTFLPKFHCELNPIEMVFNLFFLIISHLKSLQYWGWCKHRYRQIYKTKFDEAKRAVRKCLDACPVKVIQCFFNRLWRFMDAYRQGLTRKAAKWVVQKQKAYWRVGQGAMMLIKAILNRN